jgi:hypothetical protein
MVEDSRSFKGFRVSQGSFSLISNNNNQHQPPDMTRLFIINYINYIIYIIYSSRTLLYHLFKHDDYSILSKSVIYPLSSPAIRRHQPDPPRTPAPPTIIHNIHDSTSNQIQIKFPSLFPSHHSNLNPYSKYIYLSPNHPSIHLHQMKQINYSSSPSITIFHLGLPVLKSFPFTPRHCVIGRSERRRSDALTF